MFSTLGTMILIVSLLLGGGGITAVAAQSAQPDSALYSVKTWTEDARYTLADDDAARMELALQFANRRMIEIQTQLEKGQVPPAAVQIRLQNQLELALMLAAGLPADEIPGALQRVQAELQSQLRTALGWQSANPAGKQVMLKVQTLLQEQLRLCDAGLQDPQILREHLQQRQGDLQPTDPVQNQGGNSTSGAGQNPWTTGTPTPDSSYGPGPGENQNPWTDDTPTPGSSYGPGPGDNQNPWTELTPTPGSGYGPGPGDGVCETCTPNAGAGQQGTCTPGAGSGQQITGIPGSGGSKP